MSPAQGSIKMINIKYKKYLLFVGIAVLLSMTFFVVSLSHTKAAGLTDISDTMSRQKKGEDANHTITFINPSQIVAGNSIVVTFPSDFDTSLVDYTDIDLKDDGSDVVLASAPSGTTWGAVFGGAGGRVLTITSHTGTISALSTVIIAIGTNATAGDHAINNPTSSGNYTIDIVAGSDSGKFSAPILDNDQVSVAGTIDPTISFSISSNAVGFGTFATTDVRYATADLVGSTSEPIATEPVQLTASTNAGSGLAISLYDQGSGALSGLNSIGGSDLIPAAASSLVANNSKLYGVYGKDPSSLTLDSGFDNNGVADVAIGLVPKVFASTASAVTLGTVDVKLIAARDGGTKAGVYADIITLICTGNF